MRNITWIAIGLLIVVGGLGYWHFKDMATVTDISRKIPAITVLTAPVEVIDMPVIFHSFGQVRALSQAEITSEVTGGITSINFVEGVEVAAGTVLFELNAATEQAILQEALAKEKLSGLELTRKQNLFKRKAIPRQELDEAEAELEAKQAAVVIAKDNLRKTTIIAPFAGRLTTTAFSVGDYVQPGVNLVTLVDNQKLTVQYTVPERYYSDLRLGQKINIQVNSIPGKTFTAEVTYLAPLINAATRMRSVEATVVTDKDNYAQQLLPGLSVDIIHELRVYKNAIVVPEETIIQTMDGAQIFLATGGRAQSLAVTLGSRLADKIQILSPIDKDAVIIVRGQHQVRDGAFINAQAYSAEETRL